MAPEYGATMGYFPIDAQTVEYLTQTGRSTGEIELIQNYLQEQGMFIKYDGSQPDPVYSGDIINLELESAERALRPFKQSGPPAGIKISSEAFYESHYQNCKMDQT